MLLRTVEPLLTSLPTARVASAMPSREESATVATAAVSVTAVLLATELLALRACAMLSREESAREATLAATLTRQLLSRHKAIDTINRTIKLGGLWSSVLIAVGWI